MLYNNKHHVLSLEYQCFITNRLSLGINCSVRCVTECCFELVSFLPCACATVVALEKLYNRWVMDPLFVY